MNTILIWSKQVGFVQISEGPLDSITAEEEARGVKDSVMIEFIEYDGAGFTEKGGPQVLLEQERDEMFEQADEVVDYLVKEGWLPDEEYIYLYV